MIVYKYVFADALRKIVESQRIGFSHPGHFNDPFDRPRVLRSLYGDGMNTILDGFMTAEQLATEADAAWEKSVVASFTRTCDNALMWSHYADSHRGAVIEIDADRAELTSSQLLIPIQFGAVIYTKRPNRTTYGRRSRPAENGENRFDIQNYELMQRLFLSKGIAWSYEEEVRAIASPNFGLWTDSGESIDGVWKKIVLPNRTIYGRKLPAGSISRVFAGARYSDWDWLLEQSADFGFGVMRATPSFDNYDLNFECLAESNPGDLPPIF